MPSAVTSDHTPRKPQCPELLSRIQHLRRTDNTTNWYYVARTYLYLALVIGLTLRFYGYQAAASLSFWWNLPVTLVAIVMVGAGQHQLASLSHEAVHRVLFKNRYLNDLAADWLCSFPIFSSTFHYGLHHLAHHQFVNDPLRDPDLSQMESSGHKLDFPLAKGELVHVMLKQLWLPNLFKYALARAEYDSLGTDKSPYLKKDRDLSKLPSLAQTAYLLSAAGLAIALTIYGEPVLLAVALIAAWLGITSFFALLPARLYYQSRIRPLVSVRHHTMMRVSFLTGLFYILSCVALRAGYWVPICYVILWIIPLVTSFAFFMVLRQIVQHGNGDRGWLTNTRVFRVNLPLRFAVFPLGQDYHLPHHMFSSVPHYRLKELHEALLDDPEYRQQAVVIDGYFFAKHRPPRNPTIAEVLGPDYAPRVLRDVYIDNSVLELQFVEENDKADLLREGDMAIRSVRGGRAPDM